MWRSSCKSAIPRGVGSFAGDYSFARAASIPKALSETIVAMISTVIGAQSPDSFFPVRDRAIGNVAEVRRFFFDGQLVTPRLRATACPAGSPKKAPRPRQRKREVLRF